MALGWPGLGEAAIWFGVVRVALAAPANTIRSEGSIVAKVIADITMSLDGYVAGPSPDGDLDQLQAWVMDQDPADTEVLQKATAATGAVVMGRRLFDIVDGPHGWTNDMGYGAQEAAKPPFFVVTHVVPPASRLASELDMSVDFVDDLARAVDTAREVARDKHVVIMGGGDVIGQAIAQGLVDELHLHVAPIVLGSGIPLFHRSSQQRYRLAELQQTSHAVHHVYARIPG
jgi:dihydrofolate reductase